ncbi:MAG: CRISPR-associated protein Csx16 [Betaproteobacteria bacterium]|nr:CRISPR-associated protein Csx16 [Betaproteobacteria bacterium]
MTITFVTRHDGAVAWAREEGLLPEDARVVADFDPQSVAPGDVVIGTLPAQLAASVCEHGARYQHLSLDLTPELRGKELSAADMRACKARLEELFIQRSTVNPGKTRGILHLCIVSDQTLQNLIPTRLDSYQPDRIYLLQSATMKKKAVGQRLKQALEIAGSKKIDLLDDCPDHDLPHIVAWGSALIRRLRNEHPQGRFILNLTGGNKLMSAGLLQALRPWCEAIYCDTEHDCLEVLHPPGQAAIALPPDLVNVKVYLAAQGFVARAPDYDGAVLDKRRAVTCWLAENAAALKDFIGNLNNAAACWDSKIAGASNPNLRPRHGELEKTAAQKLLEGGLLEEKAGQLCTVKAHADYLRGGWLEEYCFAVGRELENDANPQHRLKRARFQINVKIDPLASAHLGKYPLNELDAAFVHRNRMLIVECKTGSQLGNDDKSQNILNKLEVLGEHAAGRFASKILLTTEPNVDAKTAERAKRYGIEILVGRQLKDLKQQITDWMDQ